MSNLKSAIEDAISAIDQTTTLFYQQKDQEGYQLLDQTLNKLMQAINIIFIEKSKDTKINIDEQKLNAILGNAMKSIETGDTILLSDILVFELKEVLNNLI